MEGKYCRVSFRVKAPLMLGQTLAISGSADSLGKYSKTSTVLLVTTPEAYPVWYNPEPVVLPLGVATTYKYCIFESGVFYAYENNDEERHIVPAKVDECVEDMFKATRGRMSSDSDSTFIHDELDRVVDVETSTKELASNTLFIACYHLPVVVRRTDSPDAPFHVAWAESLIAKSEDSVSQSMATFWIGTVSVSGASLTESEKGILTQVLKSMSCIPIFLEKEVTENAYQGYCKEVLWPIFHNVDQVESSLAIWRTKANPASASKSELVWNLHYNEYFAAYRAVNGAFANVIAGLAKPGDLVWVHDYHLLLLPKALRDLERDLSIVFFNHIPFPTSQILRSLPSARDILLSLTCADVVGFHTFDYARHFLNSTKRIIGYSSKTLPGGLLALMVGNRDVIVSMSHVSVEPARIIAAVNDPETQALAAAIRNKYLGRKIVVGVDICQRLSGGALKLAAFDQLLSGDPKMKDTVVLVQKSIRSSARQQDEATTSTEMTDMVAQLNHKHSGEFGGVVDYQEVSAMSLKERIALWLSADVFLLTPIREGLNLMPLEYILARKDLPFAGVVVASEFSNCSAMLSGSLKVNPFYTQHVADTLDKAISMDSKECAHRRQRDLGFVTSRPSSMWTKQILKDLNQLRNIKTVAEEVFPEELNPDIVLGAYESVIKTSGLCSKLSRVFVLDYGGTLLRKEKFDLHIKHNLSAISGRVPTDKMMDAVRKLSDDPRNAVIIVTGLTKLKLGGLFEDFPNVTLATSNGLVYSWGQNLLTAEERDIQGQETLRAWPYLDFNIDWRAVHDIAVPIITKFTFRTNGTCMTPRVPGIGWSYFGADPEWGGKQAAQLAVELEASLAHFDIVVSSQIQGSIEIVPKALHKGLVAKMFLERVVARRAGKLPQFALVIGDSSVDDDMFQALYDVTSQSHSAACPHELSAFTVSVGRRVCNASSYVTEVPHVESLLSSLAESPSTEAPLQTQVERYTLSDDSDILVEDVETLVTV